VFLEEDRVFGEYKTTYPYEAFSELLQLRATIHLKF
jgi:hypothetical protein